MIGIYKITNQINNKIYIGQSRDIARRWNRHRNGPFNPNNNQYECPLYRAIRKYGIENFTFEVIEECDIEFLNEREKYWIAYYNSFDTMNGYNLTAGGENAITTAKLTEVEVNQIIRLLQSTSLSQEQIGKQFGVSQREISGINKGETWIQKNIVYPIRSASEIQFRKAKENGQTAFSKHNTCSLCGNLISPGASLCRECFLKQQRKGRPSREELKALIRTTPFTTIGKKFNVSDNAIRKWCENYNLPKKSSVIKKYSDEEWAKL